MEIEPQYQLPFDTTKYPIRISQGNNGPWSHKLIRREIPSQKGKFVESELIHAVDFALPLGSEVRAARKGQIKSFWLNNDWFYEGLDPEIGNNPPFMSTNFVIIKHTDGTEAWYSHLSKQVVIVEDQLVLPGTVIGFTGKSGWIAGIPHLHFSVFQGFRDRVLRTVPISFKDYSGSLDHETLLTEGKIWFGQ